VKISLDRLWIAFAEDIVTKGDALVVYFGDFSESDTPPVI
jgi:hypothetical protein